VEKKESERPRAEQPEGRFSHDRIGGDPHGVLKRERFG
jgi:hypothetical protein